MTRKLAFWVVFVLASLGCVVFAYRYFSQAFPIVSVDIAMDREGALRSAHGLAEGRELGPTGFRQAASFGVDQRVQTFVELEGGGAEAFGRMLSEGLFAAYTWRVRHFKEGEVNETQLRFSPDGKPYGFLQKLDENAPGERLSSEEARQIAETVATRTWETELEIYDLVETSQEVRPGERIDHTFVYERPDEQLGEGRYRLRLVVSGDELTEVTYFLKIPEAFERRYEEMRAANTAIGAASSVGMLLYIAGVAVALFFLLRQRWVLWRQPLLWGLAVAFLQLLVALNSWPLQWMSYDTALSTQNFVAQQLAFAIAGFLGMTVLFSLSFMAAETLTRRAFGKHPQLWRLWSKDAASSTAILGRTAAGFLLVGFFFAYEVALYFLSTRVLGWWTPSDLLVQPDVLATYAPWLTAIASSFQAGFWEECLFRAVPLAGAALIGDRFGHRRAWLVGAFVVQALVFGAGHAAYATQPAYARVVELIVPSVAFGLIYLRLGLLAAIVLHYAFDVVWFALPLFVSTAPGVWLDQLMVVILTLVPLWVVLGQRWRSGRWQELAREFLNTGWAPAVAREAPAAEPAPSAISVGPSPAVVRGILIAGVVGVLVWAAAASRSDQAPRFSIDRQQAAAAAKQTLDERNVSLPDGWLDWASVRADRDYRHRFVWETAGHERYTELLGSYLRSPYFGVRFVTFEGDVADRAEEWGVQLSGDGSTTRVRHQLPEAREGARLTEDQALELAYSKAYGEFGLRPEELKQVSTTPSSLAARTDWQVTFADRRAPELSDGELRLEISIAGDEVVDVARFVHVPEDWRRQRRDEQVASTIRRGVSGALLVVFFLAGAVLAVVEWSRGRFSVRLFLVVGLVLLAASVLGFVNDWPTAVANFSTAQPLNLQMLMLGGSGLVGLILLSAVIALAAGVAPRRFWQQGSLEPRTAVGLALALGALGAATMAMGSLILQEAAAPRWPSYAGAGSQVPFLAAALAPISSLIGISAGLMLLISAADRLSRGWTHRILLTSGMLVAAGLVVSGLPSEISLPIWIASGVATGLVILVAARYVVRFDASTMPVIVGTMIALVQVRDSLYRAYPGAMTGTVLGVGLIALIAWRWSVGLRRDQAS